MRPESRFSPEPRSQSRIQHSQVRHAAVIWDDLKDAPFPADRLLGNYFFRNRKKLGSRDRKFLSQTIYALFRHRAYVTGWARYFGAENDSVLLAFLAALLDGQISPEGAAEAAPLDDKTLKDVLKKLNSFLSFNSPMPLRGSPEAELAFRYSFPEWMLRRWQEHFGAEKLRQILSVYEQRPPLTVRNNPVKTDRESLIKRLRAKGFDVQPCGLTPWAIVFRERVGIFDLEEFTEGFFEVQDAGSQKTCAAMGIKPGELIWDACAGGGGKSLLIGALLQNKGRVVATDIRPKKLVDLKKRAKRAGLFNVFPADLQRMDEIKSARQGFDRILVDAPCSGTGTLRRNPDAKWKIREEVFLKQQSEQVQILESVLPRLKPGGRVFYVTCSLEKEENEDVIEKVFSQRSGFKMIPLDGFGESSQWGARLWPSQENDGFFMAAAEKLKEI